MSRKPAESKAIAIISPRAASIESSKFIPRKGFQALSFWPELETTEQQILMSEGNLIGAALMVEGMSGLAVGAHFKKVHETLLGRSRAFGKFCVFFGKDKRTAYRYINKYVSAQASLPETIIRAALARGIDITHGEFTNVIEKFPPPVALAKQVIDGDKANKYLDELVLKRRDMKDKARRGITIRNKRDIVNGIRHDSNHMLMQNYRLAKNNMAQLGERATKRQRVFLDSLVGMLMTELGISSPVTFNPEAIPAAFRQGRGRPRLEPVAAIVDAQTA